jgi:hypothetical protein
MRLLVEIVTGILMHIVGDNMHKVVEVMAAKKSMQNPQIRMDIEGVWLNGEYIKTTKSNENCTHFVVFDGKITHDPYTYMMQLDNSHQFCQTHSLLMLLDQNYRKPTNVYAAFQKLIDFWTENLKEILIGVGDKEVKRAIEEVRTTQENAVPGEDARVYKPIFTKLSKMMRPSDLASYLINIMKTEFAGEYVPNMS